MEEKTKKGLVVVGVVTAIVGVIYAFSKVEAAPPGGYCCPYCAEDGITLCFNTLEELNQHILSEHPGRRLVIPIIWD